MPHHIDNSNNSMNQRFTDNARHYDASISCISNTVTPTSASSTNATFSSLESSSSLSPSSPTLPSFSTSRANLYSDTCDIIHNMIKKELEIYHKPTQTICTKTDPWRRIMINWMCKVVDVLKLPNHIVSVAVYYLDTAERENLIQSHQDYQLVSLTALQLAVKLYDSRLLPVHQFKPEEIALQDVYEMEGRIMTALKWRLHPPTFDCYINQYRTILETCGETSICRKIVRQVESKAKELARIAVFKESFRRVRTSVLAYAAMLLAMDQILNRNCSEKTKEFTTVMSPLTNFAFGSEAFVEVVTELGSYIDSDGNVTSEPVQNKKSYNIGTVTSNNSVKRNWYDDIVLLIAGTK